MKMEVFLIIWIFTLPAFTGMMVLYDIWRKKHAKKPAPVTHQATPSLITEHGEYVESLDGNRLQKRSRSV